MPRTAKPSATAGKRPRKTWLYVTAGAVPSLALIVLTVYALTRAISDMGVPGGGRRVTEVCASRLRLVAQAQLLYAEASDGRLPPASTWVDATWPFAQVKRPKDPRDDSESVFRCPAISSLREGGYGYAFNRAIGGESLSTISEPDTTPLAFDSKNVERNAAGEPQALLPGPQARHDGGAANVLSYASGNVQVLAPPFQTTGGTAEAKEDPRRPGLNPLR